ncbi:MAG: NADH-quinone oxidoreductase subunit L [Anaerolineales bacterium]|nr:NADH-quinone oxidoreductase subunit L [Anaerolineales bacterium]
MLQLTWLIPILPALAFVAIVLYVHRWEKLSARLAILAIFLSFLIAQGVFWTATTTEHFEPVWQKVGWIPMGTSVLSIGILVDNLSLVMLFMVPLVCLLIFIYSVGYMEGDPRYARFFAYVSLFTVGMLGLIVSGNLIQLFVFWEIMGLCSYLLIGFWFEKDSAANAAKKAFIVTRVGDVLLFLGILGLYSQTGTLQIREIFSEHNIEMLAHSMVSIPLVGQLSLATLFSLLIFGGAVGKSAQFPLHVWLPDAMEGPTPVSALIHAATMVAAGVYLVARTLPLFAAVEPSTSLVWVAGIGAFTAFFASTIAVAQNDIKRVLAYSTISQLGYMIMALGVGGLVAGVFHLITHAFFKALLFLGSGSVIHAMEHGHHVVAGHGEHSDEEEPFDPNDMMNMGGLRAKMPATFWAFMAGALALAGIPPLAGFWSKDEILSEAFHGGHWLVWAAGTAAAFITAFYMARQIFLTFLGEPRTPFAEEAHESPRVMTLPLIVLAIFAVFLGLWGVPADFPVLGPLLGDNPFHHLVGEVHEAAGFHPEAVPFNPVVMGISIVVAFGGLFGGYLIYGRRPLAAGEPDPLRRLGPVWTILENKYWVDEIYRATVVRAVVFLGDLSYSIDDRWVIDPLVDLAGLGGVAVSRLSRLFDIYLIDAMVNLTGVATRSFSTLQNLIDIYLVDGIVKLIGIVTEEISQQLRMIQTGRVQNYLLVVYIAVLTLLGLYLTW